MNPPETPGPSSNASAAISTRSATASPGSVCSTTAFGSCRARRPRRSPTLRSSGSRSSASARSLGRLLGAMLERVHPRLSPGAVVIVAGTADPVVERARSPRPGPTRVDGAGRADRRELVDLARPARCRRARGARDCGVGLHAPGIPRLARRLRRAAPAASVPLSVVVVFHNMRREAARTLHSLSRSYQRGIDDLDYEVIVIDNGSEPGPAAQRGRRRRASARVPARDQSTKRASPSPTVALNAGIAMARGESLALMIDGAHVLTPGVLRYGMTGAADLRARPSSRPSSGTSARASRETRSRRGTTRRSRTGCSAGSSGRPTATACSRSATSSASATGSTASSRATASSCPASSSSSSAATTTASRCPAAATRTSTCSSDSGWRRASTRRASSARAPSTSSTAARPRTWPTKPSAATASRSYGAHFRELRGRPLIGLDRPVHFVGAMSTKAAAAHPVAPRDRASRFDALRDPAGDATAGAGGPGPRRAEARRDRGALGPPGLAGGDLARPSRSCGTRPTCTRTRS